MPLKPVPLETVPVPLETVPVPPLVVVVGGGASDICHRHRQGMCVSGGKGTPSLAPRRRYCHHHCRRWELAGLKALRPWLRDEAFVLPKVEPLRPWIRERTLAVVGATILDNSSWARTSWRAPSVEVAGVLPQRWTPQLCDRECDGAATSCHWVAVEVAGVLALLALLAQRCRP